MVSKIHVRRAESPKISYKKAQVPKCDMIEVETKYKGVCGTLTAPLSVEANDPNLPPPTKKVALILHGQGGHRNYCYQKMLAHKLAERGVYSLRIDFRGCGWSDDNEVEAEGRTLGQDVADIRACVEFLADSAKNPLGVSLTLSSIIAHSRGSVAMFLWALEQDKLIKQGKEGVLVPNLINCSSRFTSVTVLDRYPLHDGEFDRVPQMMFRHGKYRPVVIMKQELVDLLEADLSGLEHLSTQYSVLSIYGLEDTIIPITDSAEFANILNRGPLSHKLQLLPEADHNFFGVIPIENEALAEDHNPLKLPLNSSKYVNFNSIVVEKIIDHLRPENEFKRFLAANDLIGSIPRWKKVEGVSNFRDLGGWKGHNASVKTNLIFRSAGLAGLTPKGADAIRDLGIKVIFDLRSDQERAKDVTPEIPGVKNIHAPAFRQSDYSPVAIAQRYSNLMTCWSTYVQVYDDILSNGGEAYKSILTFLRDNKDVPILIHCTGGKDRTGVLSMLILAIAGVNSHLIAKEYELTTYGLQPDVENFKKSFGKVVQRILPDEAAMTTLRRGRKDWSLEKDGFNNLVSSRYEAMLDTIDVLNTKYGGIENYFSEYLGFSESDVAILRDNLLESRAMHPNL